MEITSYEPGTPAWVDLTSTDPDGARDFYGALFGWEFEVGPEESAGYTMCTLRGHPVAGLNGAPAPEGMPTAWITYMASDDVDATAERIGAAGGKVMMGPIDVMEEGRLVLAFDPAEALFGVWQAGNHVGATLANEAGTIVWSELATRDLANSADFYSSVFGCTWAIEDMGDGPAYRTFSVGDRVVGGALEMSADWPAEVPAHWMPYFVVEDTEQASRDAERLGGAVSVPTTESPYGPFAVLRDPQGGAFTVMSMQGAPEA